MLARTLSAATALTGGVLMIASVGLAAPAAADVTVSSLPAKAVVKVGETVTVSLPTPAGLTCASWTTRVVGQRRVVMAPIAFACTDAAAGQVTTAVWTITAADVKKGTAVVKFIATEPDGGRTVQSLTVKVRPAQTTPTTTGRPASPGNSDDSTWSPGGA